MSTEHFAPDLARLQNPCIMVIFGVNGDLAKRKLFPALYNLMAGQFLPEQFAWSGWIGER